MNIHNNSLRVKLGELGLRGIPDEGTGLYIFWGEDIALYIGKTAWSPYARVLAEIRTARDERWFSEISRITFYPTESEEQALVKEHSIFEALKPKYNGCRYSRGKLKNETSRQNSIN